MEFKINHLFHHNQVMSFSPTFYSYFNLDDNCVIMFAFQAISILIALLHDQLSILNLISLMR